MKKNILILLLLTFILGSAKAQTITATGSVRDAKGNPLHYAFVQDKKAKNGTYTDSLGMFSLTVSPTSKLFVTCAGFKDETIDINNKTDFAVVLNLSGIATTNPEENSAAPVNNIVRNSFSDQINLGGPASYTGQGSIIPTFSIKEETKGSRYFFDKWQHGYVVNAKDSIIQNTGIMFNYDKMGGGLLLTQDRHSAIEVNREAVKSFTLYNNMNMPFTFANVQAIDKNHYVEVLATGKKYQIYKAIKTKFEKSDYHTDGVSSSGNQYDEYVDDGTYYVIKGTDGQPLKISLKKKSLKETFSTDADKLNQYMTEHSSDDMDDNYLKGLGDYLNQ